MIRLSELRLPLSALPSDPDTQPEAALRALAARTLGLADDADITALHVFKRSFDARKADLLAVYIVDLALAGAAQEAALLARHAA
ncbi:FAD dependent oxidoreductase, partial [Acidovorax delafieldii 2AN]